MNHQPFREWLLSDKELPADKAQILQEHLLSCTSCQQVKAAWWEVETTFLKTPQVSPMPGFASRWQNHLEAYEARQQKRKVYFSISTTAILVTVLFAFMIYQMWFFIKAPAPFLATWFNNLVHILSIYYSFQNIITPFVKDFPIYTFIGMFFMIGIISFMSVIWLAAYRKLSMARRYV
jgi:hypothetical protein